MGGTEASEPELSPAYVAMHEAYRRVAELEATRRRRHSIQSAMATEYKHLERLRHQLEVEEAELAAAEARAGRKLLPPGSRSRRQAAAVDEQADVEAVRIELAERQRVWEELSVSLGPAPGYDLNGQLDAARADLDLALTAWRAALHGGDSAMARWLDMSERATGEIEAQMTEVSDAAAVASEAHWRLLKTTQHLARSTTALMSSAAPAVFILGPSRYGDRARRRAIAAATAEFRRSLLRLEPELRDLYRPTRPELAPPPSLQRALDEWFSGPFSQWLATGELDLALRSVADGRKRLAGIWVELRDFHRLLQKTLAGIEQERTTRLLESPGVV